MGRAMEAAGQFYLWGGAALHLLLPAVQKVRGTSACYILSTIGVFLFTHDGSSSFLSW